MNDSTKKTKKLVMAALLLALCWLLQLLIVPPVVNALKKASVMD